MQKNAFNWTEYLQLCKQQLHVLLRQEEKKLVVETMKI